MQTTPRPDSQALFTTLDQIRAEHARLLDADSGDEDPGPDFWLAAERFATGVAESGIYFDDPHEVKACQGYLSYWQRELSRAKAEKRFSSDLDIPELKPYDEAALRALQARYANPFEGLAAEAAALPKDGMRTTRSRDELSKLVERRAGDAGLRFEQDLVKEIVGQVAGDPFAPTLVEFCLYHLFEDPKTRIGNKLRRPPNEGSLSCLQYLVDKADRLYAHQGPSEQRAMLDALSLYGAGYDPGVPSDAIISRLKIDAVQGATSPTFKDGMERTFPLCPFLVSTRLLFEYEPGLAVVHPALFRRWPELLANIRVRKDREQGRRRVLLYAAAAFAVVSLAFGAWQFRARQSEENERAANLLAADSYSGGEKRLEMALNAVKTSPSPSPTTMTALNEAIWAMLADDAKSAPQDGNPPSDPLARRGFAPSVKPCEGEATPEKALCFANTKGERVMLPGLGRDDVAFGTDPSERWVAVAWPKYGGNSKAEKIQLAVFHVRPGEPAALVFGIRDTHCEGTVANVRVSPNGSAVAIDCVPTQEGRLWDLVEVSGDALNELVIPPNKLEEDPDLIQAIYFASPGERADAVLKDGGVLEVTADAGKSAVLFRSDVLRVMGRPGHLAFLKDRGFAALGAFNAPLVMVHEATGKTLGHDAIYPVPVGFGAAKEVNYSPSEKCIEVRTVKENKDTFAYHIVLDPEVLKNVAKGMGESPSHYDAPSLCGFTGPAKPPS